VKAVLYERYGSPDVLHVEDVPVPIPATDQVRVKVAATSVNLSDWECLRGSPAYARIGGLRHPARTILGSDIAGVVDDVGEAVTAFRPGDEVFGDNLALKGGFAEYVLAPESALAHKPPQLTFAEASTIPQAGAIALQGTDSAVSGSRLLINGAGGGSGSFAIQLAKRLGAHVTGVDNAAKQDFMRSMGADDVIDYRRDDFTRTTGPYNMVNPPGRATMGGLLESSKHVTGANPTITWAPVDFLRAQGLIATELVPTPQLPLWDPPTGATAGIGLMKCDRAIAAGMKFRTMEQTVRDTLEWQKSRPAENQVMKSGLKPEREAELLKLLHGA